MDFSFNVFLLVVYSITVVILLWTGKLPGTKLLWFFPRNFVGFLFAFFWGGSRGEFNLWGHTAMFKGIEYRQKNGGPACLTVFSWWCHIFLSALRCKRPYLFYFFLLGLFLFIFSINTLYFFCITARVGPVLMQLSNRDLDLAFSVAHLNPTGLDIAALVWKWPVNNLIYFGCWAPF